MLSVVAARQPAQGRRAVEPAVDFQASVPAELPLDGAEEFSAVGAEQAEALHRRSFRRFGRSALAYERARVPSVIPYAGAFRFVIAP